MRELKFRAWHTVRKHMIYDGDIFLKASNPSEWADIVDTCIVTNYGLLFWVLKSKLSTATEEYFDHLELYMNSLIMQQFTGLEDKNGNEIFDGDICKDGNVIYEVRWVENSAKFGAKVIKSDHVLVIDCTFPIQQYIKDSTLECVFEIIGNVYENPEYLK